MPVQPTIKSHAFQGEIDGVLAHAIRQPQRAWEEIFLSRLEVAQQPLDDLLRMARHGHDVGGMSSTRLRCLRVSIMRCLSDAAGMIHSPRSRSNWAGVASCMNRPVF